MAGGEVNVKIGNEGMDVIVARCHQLEGHLHVSDISCLRPMKLHAEQMPRL